VVLTAKRKMRTREWETAVVERSRRWAGHQGLCRMIVLLISEFKMLTFAFP
jgi:hypothetical protein